MKLSYSQQEVLRTLAAFSGEQSNPQLVYEADLAHLSPSVLKSLRVVDAVRRWVVSGQAQWALTDRGWQWYNRLTAESRKPTLPHLQQGNRFSLVTRDGCHEEWTVSQMGRIPVVTIRELKPCPACGELMEVAGESSSD